MKTEKVYDVIISGAGPVGLFLACELALAKCSVLVLEKADSPDSPLKKLPFGIRGLNSPSIEALDRRGLFEDLQIHKTLKNPHSHQNQLSKQSKQGGHFAGIPFLESKIDPVLTSDRPANSLPVSLVSEMNELETIFERRALSLGVEIKRGLPATAVVPSDSEVTVKSGDATFRAKWVVGCDGARSIVRKSLGFEFIGTDPEFTGYTMRVDVADPEKLKPGRVLTKTGLYMQSQFGFIIVQDFDRGAFHASEEKLTLEHLQSVLRRVSETDVTLTQLHTATTWTDRARQATEYRRGRAFLAGDAAHIHSPLGGQGLNLGLGDAMNLGWKLASVIREEAPESLLDTYFAERAPIGEQVLDWSRAQVAIMKPNPASQALNRIFRDLIDTEDGATYFASRVWGVELKYDLANENPLVGKSAPNFEFEDGTNLNYLLRTGEALLLHLDDLRTNPPRFDGRVKTLDRRAKNSFGLSSLLIRPDGFVAWVKNVGE